MTRMPPTHVLHEAAVAAAELNIALDDQLACLLVGTLGELGLFDALDPSDWMQRTGTPTLYRRWLEHSLQVLVARAHVVRDPSGAIRVRQELPPLAEQWASWERYANAAFEVPALRAPV